MFAEQEALDADILIEVRPMHSITCAADLEISPFSRMPFAKRGYHPIGTETVRPSSRSTESVSSVTSTFNTRGSVRFMVALISFVVESEVEFVIVIHNSKPDQLQPTLSAQEVALYIVTLREIDNRLYLQPQHFQNDVVAI